MANGMNENWGESVAEPDTAVTEQDLRRDFWNGAAEIVQGPPAVSRERFVTAASIASDIDPSAEDGVSQGLEFASTSLATESSDDFSFQWLSPAAGRAAAWPNVPFSIHENEFPEPLVLKRRFQSMLAWTDREVRALKIEENARPSRGKGQAAPDERASCKSVELKAAVCSPGPGRPNSVCSSRGQGRHREKSPPLLFARRKHAPNSTGSSCKYNDFGEIVDNSLMEVMFTTSLCSKEPGSSLMLRPSSHALSADSQSSVFRYPTSDAEVARLPSSCAAPKVAKTARQRHSRILITAEAASSPEIPPSLLQETNNGLMGGTLFLEDGESSPYSPQQSKNSSLQRVLRKRGQPRRPGCLGALRGRPS